MNAATLAVLAAEHGDHCVKYLNTARWFWAPKPIARSLFDAGLPIRYAPPQTIRAERCIDVAVESARQAAHYANLALENL